MEGNNKLKIKYVKLTEIIPCSTNPRINHELAVEKVANSISNFGFKQPIIVDKNMEIIAGHTRYKAAESLKLEEVPIIVVSDLTEEQVKALRIADNKTAEYSDWDNNLLTDILKELDEIGFALEATGFDFEEVEKLMSTLDDPDLELNREDSDVKDETVRKMVVGKYKCVMTEEEYEKFEKIYLQYVEDNTTSFGFINHLLKDVK